ncbi:MAG: hypothetical protein GX902_09045 [Lentisphaerae bacterium]|nr:hypothetical protein [Lentisphaerota bacterium]
MMLIPYPKHLERHPGQHRPDGKFQLEIAVPKSEEAATVNVIRRELKRRFRPSDVIRLRIDWRSGAVPEAIVPMQAYRLAISEDAITITGGSALGALYGVIALLQWYDEANGLACVTITDWPDIDYRVSARPLLCGEACRQALDWGDGRIGFMRRWRYEIDFALRSRSNAIFCSGFDWNCAKYPQFSRDMRKLNRYALARGVKLIFSGYGIGTGGWGGEAMLSEAHNFVPGLGHTVQQEVSCSWNNPKNPTTSFNGTCRSNRALRAQKVRDLVRFVRRIEPGALYIHHEDMSSLTREGQEFFWDKRCAACRSRWPGKRIQDHDGGAAALADSFDVYGEALSQVRNRSGYVGNRDCLVIPVSPVYGEINDDDDEWERVMELWVNVACQMRHPDNVYLGFREQLPGYADPRPRIGVLAEKLRAAGCRQKIFLFAVGGADLYYNDAPFSATPACSRLFAGCGMLFWFSGIQFQRPQQLLNSEYSWNLFSPAVSVTATTREEWSQVYDAMARHREIPAVLTMSDGWLARGCRMLYGDAAGDAIFRYQLLQLGKEAFPLSSLYFAVALRKLGQQLRDPGSDRETQARLWRQRAEVTDAGRKLIQDALAAMTNNEPMLRVELQRQAAILDFTAPFARLVAAIWNGDTPCAELRRQCDRLMHRVPEFGTDFVWPGNGETELWPNYLKILQETLA